MLYMVRHAFDIGNGVRAEPEDIVDVTGWSHVKAMIENGLICITDATEATVDQSPKTPIKASATPAPKYKPGKPKRSVLAGHQRVFSRRAKQGE